MSTTFLMYILVIIVQFGLVFSTDELGPGDSKPNSEITSISLSELLSAFRREHHDSVDEQLTFMMLAASCGDRLYELPVNLSAECSRTARANLLMLEKLAYCEETFDVMFGAVDNVTRHLQEQTELLQHPLELVCKQIETRYVEDSKLKPLFEKAREDAANFKSVSRPSYFHQLIKAEEMWLKLIEKSDVPEIAKFLALLTFRNVERGFRYGKSRRSTIFAKACRAVAKKEKFADSMQNIFEKTINDLLPEIMANDRVEKYTKALEAREKTYETYWQVWVSSMEKLFYGYIVKDPILKKEVEDAAKNTHEPTSKDDLDFSKLGSSPY